MAQSNTVPDSCQLTGRVSGVVTDNSVYWSSFICISTLLMVAKNYLEHWSLVPYFFVIFLIVAKMMKKKPHPFTILCIDMFMFICEMCLKKGPIIVVTPLHAKVGGNGTPLIFWIPHCRQK